MVNANYNDVKGVRYSRFIEDTDEPVVVQGDAQIDEMYFEEYSGDLVVTVETVDGYISLNIPIKATEKWNELVASLPVWDIDGVFDGR